MSVEAHESVMALRSGADPFLTNASKYLQTGAERNERVSDITTYVQRMLCGWIDGWMDDGSKDWLYSYEELVKNTTAANSLARQTE